MSERNGLTIRDYINLAVSAGVLAFTVYRAYKRFTESEAGQKVAKVVTDNVRPGELANKIKQSLKV